MAEKESSTDRPWYERASEAHREADEACGREWSCACGPCRAAREAVADINARFKRIEELQNTLAHVRAVKRS